MYWRTFAADWHVGNFFTVGEDPTPYQTLTGTRPGDPVADLIFVLYFLIVQKRLVSVLAAESLAESVTLCGDGPFGIGSGGSREVELRPPTFMDDLVLLLQAATAKDLILKVKRAAEMLVEVFALFGLEVNFKPGKTETVLLLSGRGRASARASIWEDLPVGAGAEGTAAITLAGGQVLRIVQRYKHLGIMTTGSKSLEPELAARLSSGTSAAAALAAKVFGSRHIPDAIKAHVAAAVVASRVLHGSGTWTALTAKQYRRTEAALLRPLRRAAASKFPHTGPYPHLSNEEVRQQFKVPPLQVRLDEAKLNYAARVAKSGDPALRALIQGTGGAAWRSDLCAAAATMQVVLGPLLSGLPVPADDATLAVWIRFTVQYPGAWSRYIARYRAAAVAQPGRCAAAIAAVRGQPAGAAAEEDGEWLCATCGRTFPQRQALLAHQARVHGRRAEVRFFVSGSVCPVCSFDQHSRVRCMRHLQRAPACRLVYEAGQLPRFTEAVVFELDLADRSYRAQMRRTGCSVFAGPPARYVPHDR